VIDWGQLMTSVLTNDTLIDYYVACLADNACDETNHHAAVVMLTAVCRGGDSDVYSRRPE